MLINRLVYISKLRISSEDPKYNRALVNVLMNARIYNRARNVTGVLFVSDRICVQILEGDSNELGRLMFKISRDSRHDDVKVLYNRKATERLYGDWSMKLLSAGTLLYQESITKFQLSDEEAYARIVKHTNGIFSFTESNKKQIATVKGKHSIGAKRYTESCLSMNSWPKASQLQLTSRSIRLCSLLIDKWVTFDDLSQRLIFSSDIELNRNLEKLDSLGILFTRPISATDLASENMAIPQQKPKKKRFSQLLKGFISSSSGK